MNHRTVGFLSVLATGKRADLMVAKKSPLKKIGALQELAGVMVNRVWLSEEELDRQLQVLADRWQE